MADTQGNVQVHATNASAPPDHADEVEPAGHFRIYLGAAAGVGKTYAMLNEGHRRKQRGTDVVIGFVECHGRQRTEGLIADLEMVPRKRVEYRGTLFEEMDLAAVLPRHPEVALVDELAHTNIPGSSGNDKRWQDVMELLGAGIDVISTVRASPMPSSRSPAFPFVKGSPIGFCARQIKSNWSTRPRSNCAGGCCTAISIRPRRSLRL